jgi:hypothetical protein
LPMDEVDLVVDRSRADFLDLSDPAYRHLVDDQFEDAFVLVGQALPAGGFAGNRESFLARRPATSPLKR